MLMASSVAAASAQALILVLPHPIRAGETAWIEVRVGSIRRGEEIEVESEAGKELGVVSPFAARSGHEAGIFLMPLPRDAIRDGRIAVRLTVTKHNGSPRTPTPREVRGVKLVVIGVSR